jgi:hypothetical protein
VSYLAELNIFVNLSPWILQIESLGVLTEFLILHCHLVNKFFVLRLFLFVPLPLILSLALVCISLVSIFRVVHFSINVHVGISRLALSIPVLALRRRHSDRYPFPFLWYGLRRSHGVRRVRHRRGSGPLGFRACGFATGFLKLAIF